MSLIDLGSRRPDLPPLSFLLQVDSRAFPRREQCKFFFSFPLAIGRQLPQSFPPFRGVPCVSLLPTATPRPFFLPSWPCTVDDHFCLFRGHFTPGRLLLTQKFIAPPGPTFSAVKVSFPPAPTTRSWPHDHSSPPSSKKSPSNPL